MSENEFNVVDLFPVGYFEDSFRSNGTYAAGYHVRLGCYPYDNQPLFGNIADLNVWDKVLSKQEMELYSGCKKIQPMKGNLVNMDTISRPTFITR